MRRLETAPNHSWLEVSRRLWSKMKSDNVFGRAAELAYFFFFSIFPLLIALTSLLRVVSGGGQFQRELLRYFHAALPGPAYELLAATLKDVTDSNAGGQLSLGIAITMASASAGMVAVIEGLNTAYDVREARTWLRRQRVAFLLTLALLMFLILALAFFIYGPQSGAFLAQHVGFRPLFRTAWPVMQWPIAFLFVLTAMALIYRFAPNVRGQQWKHIFPGAIAAFLLWLAASVGLRMYLSIYNGYTAAYGSLGAVMILMLWFYLFGLAILVGGELNSILAASLDNKNLG
ncbi:MAG: YihY/virulence factor BrkB family protein [Acidobacteriota bacterium]